MLTNDEHLSDITVKTNAVANINIVNITMYTTLASSVFGKNPMSRIRLSRPLGGVL